MKLIPPALAILESYQQPYSVIQIGAYTGNTPNDPLYDIFHRNVLQYGHLYALEPVYDHFLELQKNYAACPTVTCYNLAIAKYDGLATITRYIPQDQNSIWLQQISSLKPNRHTTLWNQCEYQHHDAKHLSQWVKHHHFTETVTAKTLNSFIQLANPHNTQLIVIDAEGSEDEIIPQINFPIKYLHYEHALLADNLHQHLKNLGWTTISDESDTFAYANHNDPIQLFYTYVDSNPANPQN